MRKSELLKIDEKNSKRTVTYIVKISNINFKLAFNMKKKYESILQVMKSSEKKKAFQRVMEMIKGINGLTY